MLRTMVYMCKLCSLFFKGLFVLSVFGELMWLLMGEVLNHRHYVVWFSNSVMV